MPVLAMLILNRHTKTPTTLDIKSKILCVDCYLKISFLILFCCDLRIHYFLIYLFLVILSICLNKFSCLQYLYRLQTIGVQNHIVLQILNFYC